MDRSLVIIKPDGLKIPEVPALARRLLTEQGLTIELVYRIDLTACDVRDTWPAFESDDHAVLRALLVCYMTSGQIEVIVAAGPSAVNACRYARSAVRLTVGQSAIANGIHAPIDEVEAEMNIRKFGAGPSGLTNFARPVIENPNPGSFGRLTMVPPSEIVAAVSKFWVTRYAVWMPVVLGNGTVEPDHYVELKPGDPRSVDFGLACLMHIMPSLTIDEALGAYFAAERTGPIKLVRGNKEALSLIEKYLSSSGLYASLKAEATVSTKAVR